MLYNISRLLVVIGDFEKFVMSKKHNLINLSYLIS